MNQANTASPVKMVRSRTIELIHKVETVSTRGTSVYAPPETGNGSLLPALDRILPEELKLAAGKSSTGFVLFSSIEPDTTQNTLILPPFPVQNRIFSAHMDIQPLESLITRDYLVGIILIRMGSFAVAVARGEQIISSKISGGCIHSRHRQGGSSAARFARHREKQIEQFFTRACNYAREHFEPCMPEMDYIIYGGAWTTINAFRKQCALLSKITVPQLAPLLDIGQPGQKVLEETVTLLYSSRVYHWNVGSTN